MNSQDLHNLQEAYMDVYSEGYKPPRGKMTKRIAHKMFKGVNTLKTAHDSGEDLAGRTTGGQIASQKSEKLAKQAQKIYQTAKRHDPESSQRRERENRTVGQIAKGDPVSAKVLRDRYKKRGLPFKSKNNTTMKAIGDGLIDGVNDALGEEVNIYDIILSHLLDEGYADTQEQAEAIMVNMSEDWRESICEGYVPLRTSDEHYDDEGFPTTTRSWSKKMTNARLSVGKQKMRSRYGIGDPIGNLTKGVSAKNRLDAMKKVDDEPESVRAKRSQAKAAANRQLGTNRRSLQTSLDREHLTRSLKSS
jgi:hypothetical protein